MKKFKKIALWLTGILTISIGAYCFKNKGKIKSTIESFKTPSVECKYGNNVTNSFDDFLNCKIKNKTVVIFEPNPYHHECMPGYTKYFTQLGYNVDTLLIKDNEDSMSLFQPEKKLRMFLFDNLEQIKNNCEKVKQRFEKYNYVLIHTTDPNKKELYENLGVFDSKNSIFVAHDTKFVKEEMGMQRFFDENRVITLGNFEDGIQVNPHYFGEIKLRPKNKKTRFFITSTNGRKYDNLVEAAKTLKKENLDFEIVVVGRHTDFTSKNLPENLKDNFVFKHGLPYAKMYEEVINSDYIIINLDPENENDNAFKNLRVSGSAQLAYGFLKPALINEEFAKNYKMNDENSFIYNNKNFTQIMRKAVSLDNEEYKQKQDNLKKLEKDVYQISLENLKKVMKI